MDEMDFLGTEETPNELTQPVETQAEAVETPQEPVVEPQAEAPPPVAEPKPEPGHVPLTALMDERDKRKALEAEIAQYRQQAAQAPKMPDPQQDPLGYQQAQMQTMQQALLDTRLNMSEVAARRHHGAELTEAAKEWALGKFGSNPAFQAEVLNNPDPYDYAVQAYQRDQIASQVTADDFKAFTAWKTAQAQIAPPQAAPAPSAPVPRSIASAPSAGGVAHEPLDNESAFGSAIP